MKYSILFVCILLSQLVQSQINQDSILRSDPAYQLRNDGYLMVRLKTQQNKIDALRKVGLNTEAEAVIAEQKKKNQILVRAFKDNYDYSDVLFFESKNTEKVLKGEFEEVFVDEELNYVDAEVRSNPFFLIAEYGQVEADTNTYSKSSTYDANSKSFMSESYGDTRMDISALVIRDRNQIQLREPFPFYVRNRSGAFLKRSPTRVVKELNIRLGNRYAGILSKLKSLESSFN
jgi:hypothetical protein